MCKLATWTLCLGLLTTLNTSANPLQPFNAHDGLLAHGHDTYSMMDHHAWPVDSMLMALADAHHRHLRAPHHLHQTLHAPHQAMRWKELLSWVCEQAALSCHEGAEHTLIVERQADQRARVRITLQAVLVSVHEEALKRWGLQLSQQTHSTQGSNDLVKWLNQLHVGLPLHLTPLRFLWLLDALESRGVATVVARPRLTTTSGHRATLESGSELPYTARNTDGDVNTAFKKAVLRLSVQPTLQPDRTVELHVHLREDKPEPNLGHGGVPGISTQSLETVVRLHNHEPILLGGLVVATREHVRTHPSPLSQLPLLGRLLQTSDHNERSDVLYMLLTPSWGDHGKMSREELRQQGKSALPSGKMLGLKALSGPVLKR